MANRKSALKRIRTSEKRHQRNVAVKSSTRTFIKKARASVAQSPTEAQTDVVAAISALDRAAKKGVIHPNNAARRKSRLMKALNTAAVAAQQPAVEAAPAPARPARARSRSKTAKS